MDKSLQNCTDELQGTKAAIKMALRSSAGVKTVWTIVEGEDDVRFYSRMFNNETVTIKTSVGEDGRRGYKNVETIVGEIIKEENNVNIFGIRDRDYTSFERDEHIFPDNVFVTDNRDLEMMLFAAPSVVSEMEMWASGFSQAWQRVVPVARHLGYVRICNHVNDYSCIIRATVKPGKLWDYNTHDFNPDWQSICSSALEEVISKADLDVFIEENRLSSVSTYDICRGHDVVKLLSLALVRKEFTSKSITNKIIEAYAIEDFQCTNLYADLLIWQRNRGVTVLAETLDG